MKKWAIPGLWWGFCIGAVAINAQAEVAPRVLTLDEALAIALRRNPDVAEAQSRLEEAEARLQAVRAGRRPTLRGRGTVDHWTEDQRLFPATRNAEAGTFGAQVLGAELAARLPLYTGGRLSGETDSADWNRRAATDQLIRVRETLVFQVTALFYDLLAQDEVLRSLEAAVGSMDEQQRSIQALVEAEKAARVDLLRAHVRRAELYERQVRERTHRTVQQRAWAALLGLEDAAAPEAQGLLPTHAITGCPDAAVCTHQALAQRADYRAAQAAVSGAEASVRSARAGYRPTLSAQASFGARWMPDPSESSEDHATVGRIGLVAEIPLFDGHLTGAKVAEQAARQRGTQERLRKLELLIRFEVETALAEIAAARERVQTSRQAVAQAEETFRIMREKYDLGKGTLSDVLDAQTALVSAQTRQTRALADLAVADARRQLAVGGLLP